MQNNDKIQNNKIFARLPAAGLGNKMLVWARAYAASRQYGMELFTSSWWGVNPGAWLRRENKKRLYLHYFREDTLRKRIALFLFRIRSQSITDPDPVSIQDKKTLYVFEKIVTDEDYFKEMKPCRLEIGEALYRMLHPSLKDTLDKYETPVIGLHIRRGDFKKGSTITPEEYFIEAILCLRKVSGKEWPVTVFTDADPGELVRLYALPSVKQAEPKADILDILLLSRSRICILSISSTFSFWAGFLSDGIVLKHPGEWQPALRPAAVNDKYYEGKFDPSGEMDPRLKEQLVSGLV